MIPKKRVEDFNIDDAVGYGEFAEGKDAAYATRVDSNGEESVLLQIRRYFGEDDRKVIINILPEQSEAYAVKYGSEDSKAKMFELDSENTVVVKGPCATGQICRAEINQCYMWEVLCCGEDICGWGDSDGDPCGGWCYGSCGQAC